MSISFIILTWNSRKYLERCFDSIFRKCDEEHIDFEIHVIDNGSIDGSQNIFDRYQSERPDQFRLIGLAGNMGTTYPRNLGMKAAQGRHICILDSDTELGQGSLQDILAQLDGHSDIGLIAPRLALSDGSVQNSVKKFPAFWHKLIKIPKAVFGIRVPNLDFYEDFPFQLPSEVDSAISACWFFHRALLEKVGMLDERIFYSPEDLDFCLRIRKSGLKILYWPEFMVIHHTQQISHAHPFSRITRSHFKGLVYFHLKHGGWFMRP